MEVIPIFSAPRDIQWNSLEAHSGKNKFPTFSSATDRLQRVKNLSCICQHGQDCSDKTDTMSHILGPHNIILCTAPAIGYKTTSDVDDTLFQQRRNTGNCSNKNNKKFSCTITVASMHFYLLYNWIIFFICHARIKESFFLAYSLAQPERKQECPMNHFFCVTYHMHPRVLFKLPWFISVIICLVCILKEYVCMNRSLILNNLDWRP